jgi:hypothetical protein
MLNHGWLEFRLRIGKFGIEYDTNYGIDHRYGWTFLWDGCVCSQLEKWFVVGAWKFWKRFRMIRRYEKTLIE